jgi:uncharacterized protein (TIGR02569 family)
VVGPSSAVLRAFGASEPPVLIPGGQGQSYRSGRIVLKPADDGEETRWMAELCLTMPCDGFRVPRPVRLETGGFVFRGWQAWGLLEGQHAGGRWQETIEACVRFHAAIADVPRPSFFNRRLPNPWTVADEVTWGEREIDHHPRVARTVARLRALLRPVPERSQLIHGDFGGNVLFAEGLPPAIIDFSPYWRPVEFAIGVVVADAIVWGGARMSLIAAGMPFGSFLQHLARAELRRVLEIETLYTMYGRDMLQEIDAHRPLIEALCERLT